MSYEFRRFLKIVIVMFLGVLIGGFLLLILSNIALGTITYYNDKVIKFGDDFDIKKFIFGIDCSSNAQR